MNLLCQKCELTNMSFARCLYSILYRVNHVSLSILTDNVVSRFFDSSPSPNVPVFYDNNKTKTTFSLCWYASPRAVCRL